MPSGYGSDHLITDGQGGSMAVHCAPPGSTDRFAPCAEAAVAMLTRGRPRSTQKGSQAMLPQSFPALWSLAGRGAYEGAAVSRSLRHKPSRSLSNGAQQNAASLSHRRLSIRLEHTVHGPHWRRAVSMYVTRTAAVRRRGYVSELWRTLWLASFYELHAGTAASARQQAVGVARADPADDRDCEKRSDHGRSRAVGPLPTQSLSRRMRAIEASRPSMLRCSGTATRLRRRIA